MEVVNCYKWKWEMTGDLGSTLRGLMRRQYFGLAYVVYREKFEISA